MPVTCTLHTFTILFRFSATTGVDIHYLASVLEHFEMACHSQYGKRCKRTYGFRRRSQCEADGCSERSDCWQPLVTDISCQCSVEAEFLSVNDPTDWRNRWLLSQQGLKIE
jgi:hypothetical protein